jgi:transglutaminase-like putative cysteine protease
VKAQEQIPRNALVWIIISLFTLVLPHIERVPLWVLLVYVAAALWRVMVYRGHWSFPRWPIKLGLIFAAFAGILFSFRSVIGLEPTVALLLTAFAFKLLELKERKDAYVLLFLGYFVILTEFLFSQDLLIVLLCLVNVVLVTTALVALHRPGVDRFSAQPLGKASIMVLQAAPMMLVLFFLFPRIGPLWTVPIKSQQATTGMSEFMKPGDVSQLSRSGAVAFRVEFEGAIPPKSQLYWRGLVMSRLRENTWSALNYYEVPARERRPQVPELSDQPLRYSVIMAPTQQRWLYGLRYARSTDAGILNAADYRLFRPTVIEDDLLYRVTSWPDALLDQQLSEWRRRTELALPVQDNPRAQQLARSIAATARGPGEIVDKVLGLFREQPFVYTLQPPLLPQGDPMDAFLFDTRRGFCEHYASAFVIMMRAAGVPARVVAGYQGGEINPVNRTVIVHQFDAHAWAEVWIEGQGWVRVDPTAAVSPERIELGLEEALASEGSFLADSPLSPLRYRRIDLINQLRLRYDALTYRWQSWVVGFNADTQLQLLQRWFGEFNARTFALVILGSWALVLVPVGLVLLLRRKVHGLSRLDRLYLRFCDKLENSGVSREPGESPADFAERAQQALPRLAARIADVTRRYQRLAYAGSQDSDRELKELARAIRNLNR